MRAAKILLLPAILAAVLLGGCGTNPPPTATDAPPAATAAPTLKAATATLAPMPTETEMPTLAPTVEPTVQAALGAEQIANAEELLNTACAACHSPSKVNREHGDLAAWQQIIQRMRNNGAVLSDDDALLLAQYLAQTAP